MKFFTTDHVKKFITKQWGIQSSKKYKVKLRFCPSYHALIQHTQSKFKFIQILSQTENFKPIEDDYFISELANESEIVEQKDTKVIQFFYQITKEEMESSSEEISSDEENSTTMSMKSG